MSLRELFGVLEANVSSPTPDTTRKNLLSGNGQEVYGTHYTNNKIVAFCFNFNTVRRHHKARECIISNFIFRPQQYSYCTYYSKYTVNNHYLTNYFFNQINPLSPQILQHFTMTTCSASSSLWEMPYSNHLCLSCSTNEPPQQYVLSCMIPAPPPLPPPKRQ